MSYLEKTIIRRFAKFKRDIMVPFCEERNLEPTFKNFISYKDRDNLFPDSLNLIMGKRVSPYLFCNSKWYSEFLDSLEPDFRAEFGNNMSTLDLVKVRMKTRRNKSITKVIALILKDDYIGDNIY